VPEDLQTDTKNRRKEEIQEEAQVGTLAETQVEVQEDVEILERAEEEDDKPGPLKPDKNHNFN
jgi:hypothetical protein